MNAMWGSVAQYNEFYWPWPIALYLFLAGLSAGAIMAALIVKWKYPNLEGHDAIVKAGAFIAPVTISIGLLLLIVDLGKPLSFYWLLIKFNFTSVMTLGVLALLLYTPLAFLFMAVMFEKEIDEYLPFLSFIPKLIHKLDKIKIFLEVVLLILAVCVGIYTGFLLSVIHKIPLWNTPLLPILFLISGFSSGIAADILSALIFKHEMHKEYISYLLNLDIGVILFEILILFALFIGMFVGTPNSAAAARYALTHGDYALMFWGGVVGLGMIAPILLSLLKHHLRSNPFLFLQSSREKSVDSTTVVLVFLDTLFVIIGVIMLRYFIVYAGQGFLNM